MRQLTAAEYLALSRLAQTSAGSAAAWQRSRILLCSSLGWNPCSIAAQMQIDERWVRAVIANFNKAGVAVCGSLFDDDWPLPTDAEARAARMALSRPRWSSDPEVGWSVESLSDHLITQGMASDASPSWLRALLDDCDGVPGRWFGEAPAAETSEEVPPTSVMAADV